MHEIYGFCNFQDVYREAVESVALLDRAHFVEVGALYGASSVFMAKQICGSGKDISFDVIDMWPKKSRKDIGIQEIEYLRAIGLPEEIINNSDELLYLGFLKTIALFQTDNTILPVRLDSVSAASLYPNNSIDFLFLDADHTYEGVMKDIHAWLPKIKTGGILAGHDYDWSGVRQAVDEYFHRSVKQVSTSSWKVRISE